MTNSMQKKGAADIGTPVRTRWLTLKYFSILYLPLALGMAALSYAYYSHECREWTQILKLREYKQVELGREILDRNFAEIFSDISYIASHTATNVEADTKDLDRTHELMQSFFDFTRTRNRLVTIHMIDASGRELMRVHPKAAVSKQRSDLLKGNWSKNELFQRLQELPPGGFAISPPTCAIMDTSPEPLDFTSIRLGTPIYRSDRFTAALILEFEGRNLLASARQAEVVSEGTIMIIDYSGRWLLGADPRFEWASMFSAHKKASFRSAFPVAWDFIMKSKDDAYMNDVGLFTYKTYNIEPPRNNAVLIKNLTDETFELGCWKIVSFVPKSIMEEHSYKIATKAGLLYALLMIILAPGCLFLGRAKVREIINSDKLMRLNTDLNDTVRTMEKRNRETTLVNRLSDFLQACRSENEIFEVAARYAGNLFPDTVGAIYDMHDADSELVQAATWGREKAGKPVFKQELCWAMRRGRTHFVPRPEMSHNCDHFVDNPPENGYLCAPLIAHGKVIGLLHFEFEPGALDLSDAGRAKARESLGQLAMTISDHVALSLANLRLRESLKNQSIRDGLTGLFNRRHMEESLAREFSRAKRQDGSVALIMFDVDHFKRFNDEHGHEAGDSVLKELAAMLQNSTRGEDIACRYGGEEFLIIMPGASAEFAQKRAEEFRRKVEKTLIVQHGEKRLSVTVSLGVAAFPEHAGDVDEALTKVDQAMYAAKEAGRNTVRTASS